MIDRIYLDLDGVLVDLAGHLARTIRLDATRYDLGLSESGLADLWSRLPRQWWADLPWTPLGRQIYRVCLESGLPVTICTTPASPDSAAGKIVWCERELGRHQAVMLCSDKSRVAIGSGLLVDDRCLEYGAAGGCLYLWPAPWNQYSRQAQEKDLIELERTLATL